MMPQPQTVPDIDPIFWSELLGSKLAHCGIGYVAYLASANQEECNSMFVPFAYTVTAVAL